MMDPNDFSYVSVAYVACTVCGPHPVFRGAFLCFAVALRQGNVEAERRS